MSDGDATANGTQQGTTASGIVVSARLQAEHPAMVDLILKSESMNNEERRYWLDILPVMTPEQIQQLNNILQNERDQLAAIDAKYAKKIDEVTEQQRPLEEIAHQRRSRAGERLSQEEAAKAEEMSTADELLDKIEDL